MKHRIAMNYYDDNDPFAEHCGSADHGHSLFETQRQAPSSSIHRVADEIIKASEATMTPIERVKDLVLSRLAKDRPGEAWRIVEISHYTAEEDGDLYVVLCNQHGRHIHNRRGQCLMEQAFSQAVVTAIGGVYTLLDGEHLAFGPSLRL